MVSRWGLIAMVAGLLLTGLLIQQQDLIRLWQVVSGISWGILPILIIHFLQLVFAGLAWRTPVAHLPAIPNQTSFIQIRWIRESLSGLLPITQIGGELISIRLMTMQGMKGSLASASLVIDLTMEAISLLLFTLVGLTVLLLTDHTSALVKWVLIGIMLMTPAILGFLLAQRYGIFKGIEKFCNWIADRSPLLQTGAADGLHESILKLYQKPRALLTSCNQHLIAWGIGTLEVWLILYLLGYPITLVQALILESLGQAIRSAAFFIPGGLGVQEGGYLLLGNLFGLPPEAGLALSLIKRVREIILGLPGLLAWQIIEGRHLIKNQPVPVPDSSE